MSSPNGSGGQFKVIYSETVREALKTLIQTAKAKGMDALVRAALKEIDSQLATTPTTFGEPLYDLKAVGLHVRTAIITPLAVVFSVDEEAHRVYVLLPFKPAPGIVFD